MYQSARALFASLVALVVAATMGCIPASAVAAPPTATTEAATAVSYEQATLKGTVNPEGSATTYYFEYGKTEAYGTKIPISPESVGSGTSNVAVSQTPTGLSQSTTYHFRVVAEGEATTEGEDLTFTTAGFNFEFGEEGSGNGQLKQPNLGIATDSEGNIWVADTENNRVEKFNSKGEYLAQFGKEGAGNGEFKAPKGLAIGPLGNIWVVDSGNNRVQKFNAKGEYVSQCGEKGSGEGQFNSPAGITFSGSNFFIVDSGNNRVQKFNSSCNFLAQFGKEGSGDGELKSPTGAVIEASGVWVTDTGNNRVQKFNTSTFKYVSKFGGEGSGEGQFESPAGIVSDFQDRLWVVDLGNDRAEKFTIAGEYLDQIGESGSGAGQLSNPTGVAIPAPQKVLILDTGNSRVESWTVKAEPPHVVTRPATELKASSAVLNANIDPEALATSYWFEYGTTTAYGTKVPITSESIGSGSSVVKVNQTASGLSKGTTYHFRAVAESAAGTVGGEDKTFKLESPKATTEAATAIKATQATLNGKVDPEGSATSYWFEYDTTEYKLGEAAHGTKIPITPQSVGSGSSNVAVSQAPTGLKEGTTYHFRIVAESEVDTTQGDDKSFTALKLPDASTESATAIKATQATLNGKVNPLGSATKYWFEYGKTESYGTKIPVSPASVGSGTEYVAVSQTPTGLSEVTEYHFRVVAETEAGTVKGADKTFMTLKLSKAKTEGATAIKRTEATLNAQVNPEGLATTYWFEYGKTKSYGTKIPVSPASVGSGTEYVAVSQTPTGLSEGTEYHFRVVAENEAGTVSGVDKTLKTFGPPKVLTGSATAIEGTQATLNAQVNPEGLATTYFFEYGLTTSYGTTIPVSPASIGSGTEYVAVSQTPTGLSKGTEYHFRVVAENEAGTIMGADKTLLTEADFAFAIGTEGPGESQFLYPGGIATDPEGNVWVADTYNARIQEFDSEGKFIRKFGSEGSGNGEFSYPYGIATDPEGNVWVADTENHRIQEFDSEGKFIRKFGSEGSGNGQFLYPEGIAIDPKGNVWVADTYNARIQEFDAEGGFIRKFSEGYGPFYCPHGIAADPEGNVWVVDPCRNRVEEFNSEGKFMNIINIFGWEGNGNGEFSYPYGIATDSEGNVWVADTGNNRVQKFSAKGAYVGKFGSVGTGSGQFIEPLGIATDPEGSIWVADTYNNRIQKWIP